MALRMAYTSTDAMSEELADLERFEKDFVWRVRSTDAMSGCIRAHRLDGYG